LSIGLDDVHFILYLTNEGNLSLHVIKWQSSISKLNVNLSFQEKKNESKNSLNLTEDPPEIWTFVKVKAELADCQSDENNPQGGMEQE
jgi:hypothetical protein